MDEQLWKVVDADGKIHGPMSAADASALHIQLWAENPDGPIIRMVAELDAPLSVPLLSIFGEQQ
ncbi:hypothetical protein VOM14_06020 [Paraburkholderia sp. MPAMCS5]|uniref:hypothetical protein n=1 Tax=Paraburkholderia sp. MPAMCS5 TaxID=3112563 RepID=UPI002E17320A|nr:hypothetical protein [Paraburkholderia sp. MPAMCS5]